VIVAEVQYGLSRPGSRVVQYTDRAQAAQVQERVGGVIVVRTIIVSDWVPEEAV
jgi:hypothetical protein